MVKNPNWQEADQLAIYKRSRGVELGATEKQLLLAVRAGLEPGASRLQVWCPNPLDHTASSRKKSNIIILFRKMRSQKFSSLSWLNNNIIYYYPRAEKL